MKKTVNVMFIAGCLFLAGCAMGPDFKPPEIETPANYNNSTETRAVKTDLIWWELFDDPVLYTLVTEALGNNKNLKIAVARMEEAAATLGYTKADRFPRLDIDAGASTGTFAGGTRSETTNTTAFIAPTLRWEIDFWGKYRRATEAAQAQLIATDFGLRSLQLSLISEVVGTYYLLLDYQQRLFISKETLATRLKSLDIIQQRFDEGILPEIDLNQAQIQKEIAAAAIPFYERAIAKTEHALSILSGRLPQEITQGKRLNDQPIPPGIPAGLPAQILEQRPDIAQSFYTLNAQTARIGVATAMRLPAISLTGALGYASTEIASVTSDGGIWSLGGTLLGPILDFGKGRQRVVIEEALARQALFEYENTVLNAFREVEDALVEVETLSREINAVSNKLKAARNAKELSNERYDKGVTSYLEVLEADRTLFSVELEYSDLKQRYLNAYVTLYKSLGGGWISKEKKARTDNGVSKDE